MDIKSSLRSANQSMFYGALMTLTLEVMAEFTIRDIKHRESMISAQLSKCMCPTVLGLFFRSQNECPQSDNPILFRV